jgi:hypothetical protein
MYNPILVDETARKEMSKGSFISFKRTPTIRKPGLQITLCSGGSSWQKLVRVEWWVMDRMREK